MNNIELRGTRREIMLNIFRRNIKITIHRMSEWSASGRHGGAGGVAKWNKIEREKQQQSRSRLQPNTNRSANDSNHKIDEFLLFQRSISAAAKLHCEWLLPSKCAVITSRCATLAEASAAAEERGCNRSELNLNWISPRNNGMGRFSNGSLHA